MNHSATIDQRQVCSPRSTALPRCGCTAIVVTTTSSGMVIDHTTMQYRHSAPMVNTLW